MSRAGNSNSVRMAFAVLQHGVEKSVFIDRNVKVVKSLCKSSLNVSNAKPLKPVSFSLSVLSSEAVNITAKFGWD